MARKKSRKILRWKRLNVLDPYTKEFGHFHTAFHDAKEAATIPIVFDNVFNESKSGMTFECVISFGIVDHVKRNPDALPHKCLGTPYVQDRSIFIFDKKMNEDRPPTYPHSIRYLTNVSELTAMFDDRCVTLAMLKKRFGDVYMLHLRPAKKRGGDEAANARDTRVRERPVNSKPPQKKTERLVGAFRRARAAGYY
jgi:hypothetical protein